MIYITGDTHIPVDIQKLSARRFSVQKTLTEKDVLIICGDFGGVWDNSNEEHYWRKWLDKKNFTTIFIDGNHENFNLLENFPVVEKFGAKVHKISEKIYHLMRGQVAQIDGRRIFAMGGAASHDKAYRTEGKNWWAEELPSVQETEKARQNLEKNNWCVDLVITHCAPTSIQEKLTPSYEKDVLTDFLEEIKESLQYEKWFFGHYHRDERIDEKHIAVFQSIVSAE